MGQQLSVISNPTWEPSPTLRDVAGILFRQRRVFLVSFGLIVAVVILRGIFAPSYRAEMKILVRHDRLDPMLTPTPTQSPLVEQDEVTEEQLNSEVELIQDRDILRSVASDSGLLAGWRMPWNLGGSDDARLERAVRALGKDLDVEPVKKSALITVTYDSSNPEQAANVLRCLGAAYLKRHQEVQRPSGQFTFFSRQVVASTRDLQQAEARLMGFTQSDGVVSAALERDIALKKLSDADANYHDLEVTLLETRQRVSELEATLKTLPERATTIIRSSDNQMLLGQMKSRLLDLNLQRSDLLAKFQPSYRVVQEVDQQIAETKASIAAENRFPLLDTTTQEDPNHEWTKAELVKNRIELSALEARAAASASVLSAYKSETRQLGGEAIEQEQLLQSLKQSEDKYLLYVNKREEARIGDALDQGGILNAAIAEEPQVPALPIWSLWMFGAIGLLSASCISTGLAFSADYLARGFRTPQEVIAYLGSPVLASLPEKSP